MTSNNGAASAATARTTQSIPSEANDTACADSDCALITKDGRYSGHCSGSRETRVTYPTVLFPPATTRAGEHNPPPPTMPPFSLMRAGGGVFFKTMVRQHPRRVWEARHPPPRRTLWRDDHRSGGIGHVDDRGAVTREREQAHRQ